MVGIVGVLVLAGCNLGVNPVTYQLVDAEQANWPLHPNGLAAGDVDGDGDPDAVATGFNGYAVLTNDGSGSYTVGFPNTFEPPTSTPSLVDVDGDGDLDLLALAPDESRPLDAVPAVRRNDGAGAFGAAEPVEPDPPPGRLTGLVPVDADSDGDVDLLAGFVVGQERHVGAYLNDGTGAYGPPTTYPLGYISDRGTSLPIAAGDLDGDGDHDAVAMDAREVTGPDGETVDRAIVMVALNDGTGAFTAAGDPIDLSSAGPIAIDPTLVDFDEDGRLDIVLVGGGGITLLSGDGAGGFAAPQSSPVPDGHGIRQLTPADMDGDGHVDLIGFENLEANSGLVAYGNGAGGIAQAHAVLTGARVGDDGIGPVEVEITDLESDGDPDILFLAGNLGVVENATQGRPTH